MHVHNHHVDKNTTLLTHVSLKSSYLEDSSNKKNMFDVPLLLQLARIYNYSYGRLQVGPIWEFIHIESYDGTPT